MSTPESIVLRQVLDYLRFSKVFAFRVNNGGIMRGGKWCPSPNQTKGVADIIGIYKGSPIAIEVKAPKGKVSEDQERFLTAFKLAGGHICVARSVTDVQFFLEQV